MEKEKLGLPEASAIDGLARGIVSISDRILAFYDDPKNEAAFQAFLAAGGIDALVDEEHRRASCAG